QGQRGLRRGQLQGALRVDRARPDAPRGAAAQGGVSMSPGWSLVLHGGSGVIDRADLSPEQDKAYRAVLARAAEAGAAVLRIGGAALDAVEVAIHVLEDDPLFNAGRG